MARAGRDSRFWFERGDFAQAQPVEEIYPASVINDQAHATQWLGARKPFFVFLAPALGEFKMTFLVVPGICRIETLQSQGEFRSYSFNVSRIKLDMRIAKWVHVTLCPVNRIGDFKQAGVWLLAPWVCGAVG